MLKEYRDYLVGRNMIVDTVSMMNQNLKEGKKILVEGYNSLFILLIIIYRSKCYYARFRFWNISLCNFIHNNCWYLSSFFFSELILGGVSTGLGIPPGKIETTIGIVKVIIYWYHKLKESNRHTLQELAKDHFQQN